MKISKRAAENAAIIYLDDEYSGDIYDYFKRVYSDEDIAKIASVIDTAYFDDDNNDIQDLINRISL